MLGDEWQLHRRKQWLGMACMSWLGGQKTALPCDDAPMLATKRE
jgi:hypothetical protein